MRALAFGALLALGCTGATETPEDRVRAVLAALEAGAQSRDVGAMKEHVSDGYRDQQGHDKRELGALIAAHLLGNRSVHLLTRVREIELPTGDTARVLAIVAMAGTPIPGPEALPALRADVYRIELELHDEDGDWRVARADWRPASLAEF